MKHKNILISIIILIIILLYFLMNNKNIEAFENIDLNIQSSPTSGFFSNFNKLITYLVDNPSISKITFDMRSFGPSSAFSYIKENEELFSKIFENYDEGLEINKTIYGKNYEDDRITGAKAYNFYNNNRNKLQPFHDAYNKYIKIRSNNRNIYSFKCPCG